MMEFATVHGDNHRFDPRTSAIKAPARATTFTDHDVGLPKSTMTVSLSAIVLFPR